MTIAATIFSAAVGVLLDSAIREMIESKDAESKAIVMVLFSLAVVFILLLGLIHLVNECRDRIARTGRFRVEHWGARVNGRRDADRPAQDRSVYEFCSEKAWEANKSIHVFGPLFTDQFIDPNATTEPAHDRYLEQGIEKAVERHFDLGNPEFKYVRVAQVADGFDKAINKKKYINADAFGNEALAKHVKRVLDRDVRGLSVEISVRNTVPTFPSTLVIDNQWVFFSLPTRKSANMEYTAHEFLAYDFVLGIEDASGVIPSLFIQMIEQFNRHATKIEGVT